ncbi:hypothetical protein ACQBAR_13845 [Propionibacteriaceae bacterium Y1685]
MSSHTFDAEAIRVLGDLYAKPLIQAGRDAGEVLTFTPTASASEMSVRLGASVERAVTACRLAAAIVQAQGEGMEERLAVTSSAYARQEDANMALSDRWREP